MIRVRALTIALFLACVLSGCSKPPKVSRVIFVTWDTTRADRLGSYGYEGGTSPNLDRLAAESVLFESAVSQVPTTMPSHSTMFTGLYPQDHGVHYNLVYRLNDSAHTLAEMMQLKGFKTAAFPAAVVLQEKYGLNQGFDHWVEPEAKRGEQAYSAEQGVDAALSWLATVQDSKLFMWLHFYDPHSPLAPPFPYSAMYRDRLYDGEIAYTDAQFGRLMDTLRADPAWDETVVVVAGDHGEGLHDHGERWHSYLVYESTQHVPLLIRAPGKAPRRVQDPVVLADLTPTVLELVDAEVPAKLRGVSLLPAMRGKSMEDRFLYFETNAGSLNYGWQELAGVRFRNWKLIDSSAPELFDLAADPGESDNLAAAEPERVERFRAELARLRVPIRESTASQTDQQLTAEEVAMLTSLGYVPGAGGGSAIEGAQLPQNMILLESEIASARLAISQRQWPRIEELCDYVLERDPANKWALTNLTSALLALGRAQEADAPSKALLNAYPTNPNSFSTRGQALSEMGRAAEAYELMTAGRLQMPESEAIGYFLLVAGFDADEPVCDGTVREVLDQFPTSGRTLVMQARCDLRGPGGLRAALNTLTRAAQLGYTGVENLKHHEEFKELAKDSTFGAIVQLAKNPNMLKVDDFAGNAPGN